MLNKAQLCKECRTCKKWNKCPYGKEGLENGTSIGYSIGECKDYEPYPYEDAGELSDGYHTFNQLYHQRAILFATIVNQNKNKAWKSFKHSDGKYCFDSDGEWFIVGVDTPQGSYTYHYHKKYWDYFDCKELEYGKVWDGHTEEDVTRLLSLEQQPCEDCISRQKALDCFEQTNTRQGAKYAIETLPSVTPKGVTVTDFADKCKECGKIQNELSEDAVSRKKVIILIDEASEIHPYKVVGDSDTYSNYNQGWSDACDWLYANIDGIPSVTPERPKGKWMECGGDEPWLKGYCCSLCNFTTTQKYDYCTCGAEMGGADETN